MAGVTCAIEETTLRPSPLVQIGPLAQRSIARTFRRPPVVATGFVFPLILFAFTTGGLGGIATKLPGFPTGSYTTFALGLTFAYTGIYAVTVAGGQLGEDVQTGFVRRIALTAVSAPTLVFGQLAGVVAFATLQAVAFIGIGLLAGAHIRAGVGGAVVLIALSAFYAVALGMVGMFAAVRTRSGQAVQAIFPLLIAFMLMSSMNLPRNIIRAHWFRTIATYNPVSYLIEAPRSLLVSGWDAQQLGLGFAVAGAILVGALIQLSSSMRELSVAR